MLGTTPLTVKQIADAQLAGAGERGEPFAVDSVETTSIRVVGTVSGKAERATDVSFTLDDGTGRPDFIRCLRRGSYIIIRAFLVLAMLLLAVKVAAYL